MGSDQKHSDGPDIDTEQCVNQGCTSSSATLELCTDIQPCTRLLNRNLPSAVIIMCTERCLYGMRRVLARDITGEYDYSFVQFRS
jgi:hypothetical protein